MNLRDLEKYVLPKWFVLLVLLSVTAFASRGEPPKKSAPAGHSAPSKPASHAAPSHAAGHATGGGHSASTSHAASGGHSTATSHTAAGGHTATTSHAAAGGHTATTSHATAGSHTATTGHTGAAGGHAATTSHAAAGGHTGNEGHAAGGGHAMAGGHATAGGHTPAGTRNVSLKGGGSASIRSNGQIRSVNRNGMHIDRGVHGGRTVVSEHNGVRVVNTGAHGGYVQRSYMNRGGHSYYSRTYFDHGNYHVGIYRGYSWHGHAYFGYHPGFWFHPGFYAWGFHPWGAPLYWGVGLWGWGGAPWYGFYGGWFTPYPYYASPAFWLTDYLIAADLQSAYEARSEANADAMVSSDNTPAPATSSAVTLTPEVKEAIAEEVKAELAAQQAEAAQSGGSSDQAAAPAPASANSNDQVPPALDPARRTFVVDSNLTVVANGQECGLTSGDVLTRLTDTPDADNTVNASVSGSKQSDCAAGQTVAVKVDDLQEMQNHFAEQVDSGLSEMAKKQGTDGMPKAPDTGTTPSDVPPPQPDTTAEKTLQDQQQQADQTEAQVKQEAAASGGGQ
jgi:hypothetical protein